MHAVRLMGGLGNQMFQYALARRLTAQWGRRVLLDVESDFKNDPYGRQFALEVFQTRIERGSPQDVPLGMDWPWPWRRLAKAVWSNVLRRRHRVVYERQPFRFDPDVVRERAGRSYFFGYWQNEEYLLPIEASLRQEFTLRAPLSTLMRSLMGSMAGCRSISVHVRRNHGIGADGKVIRLARERHGTCPVEYYHRAMEHIGKSPGTVCYIFSDNPSWAKANLALGVPCRYVCDSGPWSDAEELLLMASCRHHVIANSSFSWWGAWLGRNPGKIVVAPTAWGCGLPAEVPGLCPKEWIRA